MATAQYIVKTRVVLGEQIEAHVYGWHGHWNYRLWSRRSGTLTTPRWSTTKVAAMDNVRRLLDTKYPPR